jgi:tetratricopeptide (TPR) repeat protein
MTFRSRVYFLTFMIQYLSTPGMKIFLFLLFTVQPRLGWGQDKMAGNPKAQSTASKDTLKVDRLNERSAQNILLNRKDSASFYANLAMEEAIKMNYIHGMARALSCNSQIEKLFNNDFILSKKLNEDALTQFEKTPNQEGMDMVLNSLFHTALVETRFDEAMDYGEKYHSIALRENDQNKIFISLTNMFSLYQQTGNYEKSFDYAQQLYDIAVQAGSKRWLASSLWGLAELYRSIEDYPSALNYYQRVREISDPEVKEDRMHIDAGFQYEMQFAEVFSLTNHFDSALQYYRLYKPSNKAFNRFYLTSMGEYHYLKGNYEQALQNFQLALPEHRQQNDVNEGMRTLLDIALSLLVLDNPAAALKYARQGLDIALQNRVKQYIRNGYKILSDAYGRLQQTDSSNYYFRKYTIVKDDVLNDQTKGKFAAYKYEQRISMISKEKEIQSIQLQKQTLMKNILIGGIALLLLFAFIFSRNILLKRRSEARRRELAENELRIQKLESEKSMAELMQQRAELEMKALRAQMNPHFIFNCLNSINRFIIRNDAEQAADYLTKFAKLIRIVLEKSGKSFIPLKEELDSLKLYMDLETLRFEKPFDYEINCFNMDTESVLVPSLIIQPFVENAIWHGLHPNVGCHGIIKINLKQENGILLCEISDNGVGMASPAELSGNDRNGKKSLGIELTKNRLRLADPLHKESLGITIQHLTDETGKNKGTSVHIKIPVKTI